MEPQKIKKTTQSLWKYLTSTSKFAAISFLNEYTSTVEVNSLVRLLCGWFSVPLKVLGSGRLTKRGKELVSPHVTKNQGLSAITALELAT